LSSRLNFFPDDQDFQYEFDYFMEVYGKTYENAAEKERRRKIFFSNLLFYSA